MKKRILTIGMVVCIITIVVVLAKKSYQPADPPAPASSEATESASPPEDGGPEPRPTSIRPDFELLNDITGFDFGGDLLDDAYQHADNVAGYYTEQLFDDEDSLKKEAISSEGISNIKLESIYGAVYIEASPDADVHLEYPEKAHFTISHETKDGDLTITAKVSTPSNYDVLKVYIPLEKIKNLAITEGASSIHLVGQEGMLESLDIEAALATVYLENIYADTKVKTGTGTIRMSNDTIKSNIHLITKTGVVDVGIGELPDDVSIYTNGNSVRNSLTDGRESVSPTEKYAVTLENSVGGINIHKED